MLSVNHMPDNMESKTNILVLHNSDTRPYHLSVLGEHKHVPLTYIKRDREDTNIFRFHPLGRFLTLSQPPGSSWSTTHTTTRTQPKTLQHYGKSLQQSSLSLSLTTKLCQLISGFWRNIQLTFIYNYSVFQNKSTHQGKIWKHKQLWTNVTILSFFCCLTC